MKDFIPTPAVFAGSLARTFEYRTAGVHSTPQVRWIFTTPGRAISCPVLVDRGVIYVADEQGCFSAIKASSGDLLWSFQGDNSNAVTAVCLDETSCYLGFWVDEETDVPMLVELDLETGEVRRSWMKQTRTASLDLANSSSHIPSPPLNAYIDDLYALLVMVVAFVVTCIGLLWDREAGEQR